jgi:hypothetical protein
MHFVWGRNEFLGSFAKFLEARISFFISVHPSVCLSLGPSVLPHKTTRVQLDGFFKWNLIFEYFSKICRENSGSLESDNNNEYLTRKLRYICDGISLNSSYNEKCFRQMLQRNPKYIFYFFLIVVFPCMLTIIQLLFQQNSHVFYY